MKKLLQIHITDKCNLRCKHCYQVGMERKRVLDIDSFRLLMKQFDEFKNLPDYEGKRINITGGEPLLIDNIMEYIDIAINSGVEKINFLTNGILFNKQFLNEIKKRKIVELQVSLEGPELINDQIRGYGTFKKIINGIKMAKENGLYIKVSCTLNSINYKYVSETIDIIKESGADMIWFDRMTPFCDNNIKELTTEQFLFSLQKIREAKIKYANSDFIILLKRALQFLYDMNDQIEGYKCGAVIKNLTILPDGTVQGCPRMPISLGNFKYTPLIDIYNSSVAQEMIKCLSTVPQECKSCDFKENCLGGLRCLTYAVTKKIDKGDINCPFLLTQ